MKNKKTALLLAVCLSLGTLAGCSTEEINNYRQAELDLADGISRLHWKNMRRLFQTA